MLFFSLSHLSQFSKLNYSVAKAVLFICKYSGIQVPTYFFFKSQWRECSVLFHFRSAGNFQNFRNFFHTNLPAWNCICICILQKTMIFCSKQKWQYLSLCPELVSTAAAAIDLSLGVWPCYVNWPNMFTDFLANNGKEQ